MSADTGAASPPKAWDSFEAIVFHILKQFWGSVSFSHVSLGKVTKSGERGGQSPRDQRKAEPAAGIAGDVPPLCKQQPGHRTTPGKGRVYLGKGRVYPGKADLLYPGISGMEAPASPAQLGGSGTSMDTGQGLRTPGLSPFLTPQSHAWVSQPHPSLSSPPREH